MHDIREVDFIECWKIHNQIPEFDKRDLDSFKQRLEGHRILALVYYAKQVPQGFALSYDLSESTQYLWLAGVIPTFRKQGCLDELLRYIENFSKGHGYTELSVKSMNKFRPMLHFLLKNNFNITAVEEDSKILFQKKLI